jgi:hypothetical protein
MMSSLTEDQRMSLEAIRALRARRDYLLDNRDWEPYAALHADEHVSVSMGPEQVVGGKGVVDQIKKTLEDCTIMHHSHSPIIEFQDDDNATGIWSLYCNTFTKRNDFEERRESWGYYHERYVRRDGVWLFTYRRVEFTHTESSPGNEARYDKWGN